MRIRTAAVTLALALATFTAADAVADGGAGSTILENDFLFVGQRLVSDSCFYHLEVQNDVNVVVYAGVGSNASQAVWSTGQSEGSPIGNPIYFVLQDDANLVEYNDGVVGGGFYIPLWSSQTAGRGNAVLWLQNDGNLVVYPAEMPGQGAFWWTGTHGVHNGPSPCPMQTRYTQMLFGMNQQGNDYESLCTNDGNLCGQWCADAPGRCAAWTWTPGNAPGSCSATEGQCWLKSAVPQDQSYYFGMTSGIVRVYTP